MNSEAHEELHVRTGRRSGLRMVVAIHSTVLGPALGGARLWRYRAPGDGIADALRLSEAMTYKAAAAGLDLGGGKSAICAPEELHRERRHAVMLDLGDLVESLEGRYVVAEDVGTRTEDMTLIAERTDHVVGLPVDRGGSGDPSPFTARGVEAAIRSACAHAFETADLGGVRVCVVGLGHVGSSLAERLAGAGAELLVTDVDPGKRTDAERMGARWVEPEDAIAAECDVLAPCALGGAIDEAAVGALRCAVICGSANNILASASIARELHRRRVTYAPDFIANAGGLISVYAELRSLPRERSEALVEGIGGAMAAVLAESERSGETPLAAAHAVARARLDRARGEGRARLVA